MLELKLETEYKDETTAKNILLALKPENKGYVDSELKGNAIVFTVSAEDAGSMKNTMDDLLACLKIAEESSGLVIPAANLDSDSLLE